MGQNDLIIRMLNKPEGISLIVFLLAPLWVVVLLLGSFISERGTRRGRGSWFGYMSAVLEECLLREEFENCENLGINETFSVLSCGSYPIRILRCPPGPCQRKLLVTRTQPVLSFFSFFFFFFKILLI